LLFLNTLLIIIEKQSAIKKNIERPLEIEKILLWDLICI